MMALLVPGCRQGGPLKVSEAPPVNLAAEIQRAKTEHKLVVLEFSGSDWCQPCMDFHKRVAANPEFIAYSQSNFVWLELDFPEKFKLRPETEATNRLLLAQFKVEPFPTFIVLDHDGREIWRQPDLTDPNPSLTLNPAVLITQLEAVRRKQF